MTRSRMIAIVSGVTKNAVICVNTTLGASSPNKLAARDEDVQTGGEGGDRPQGLSTLLAMLAAGFLG